MTYIAYTYQMSAPSHMSTDVNKHLQTAEQTVIREGANRTEDFLAVLLGLSASTSSQRQVNNLAMARSQGLWRLDERASPKGVNGNVLNLKHQPLCQNHRGRGGNRHLHEREATVVCPDWEGHGGDSISYSLRWYLEDRGQGCQSSQGSEVGDGGGLCVSSWKTGGKLMVLSFTPADLNYCHPVWTANSLLTLKPDCQQHLTLKKPLKTEVLFTQRLVFLSDE